MIDFDETEIQQKLKMTTIHIDGSHGEGGGQVLRSSLALSLVTGRPFHIDNIRAKRKKPGLMRQHLTAFEAACKVGGSKSAGVKIGSTELEFTPGTVRGGEYQFNVGSAGSVTLVLQTVLPALMLADEPSLLTLRGGTHNPMAPPFNFLRDVYLPLVQRMGPKFDATLLRHGFYPAGGGEFTVRIEPVKKLAALQLMERGKTVSKNGRILYAKLPEHIPQRERQELLKRTGWNKSAIKIEEITESHGPGNAMMLQVVSENVTEMFSAFGELGVSAENVCKQAVEQYRTYLKAEVPVGEHLADQLLLPLGIAAWQGSGDSTFRTVPLTQHSKTHIDILKRFLEIDIRIETEDRDKTTVFVS